MPFMQWDDRFMNIFNSGVARFYTNPQVLPDNFFNREELELLAEIGCNHREMHNYIRTYANYGRPTPSNVLLITSVCRSYFLIARRGISGNTKPFPANSMPHESEELQGMPYLPRLIKKAQLKLYGSLDPSLLYGDEQDTTFLMEHGNIHPADFLMMTWHSHGDQQKLITSLIAAIKSNEQTAERDAADAFNLPRDGELF